MRYPIWHAKKFKLINSTLDDLTRATIWHSKNVLVEDSIVKGEYLGWFSDNLTLKNCTITGIQPLCYCKMINTDLSFEYSDVNAQITGNILSIKNPKSGLIIADSVAEVIFEDAVMP